jgi:hypothetical protein
MNWLAHKSYTKGYEQKRLPGNTGQPPDYIINLSIYFSAVMITTRFQLFSLNG